MISKLLLYYS